MVYKTNKHAYAAQKCPTKKWKECIFPRTDKLFNQINHSQRKKRNQRKNRGKNFCFTVFRTITIIEWKSIRVMVVYLNFYVCKTCKRNKFRQEFHMSWSFRNPANVHNTCTEYVYIEICFRVEWKFLNLTIHSFLLHFLILLLLILILKS